MTSVGEVELDFSRSRKSKTNTQVGSEQQIMNTLNYHAQYSWSTFMHYFHAKCTEEEFYTYSCNTHTHSVL